jgi:hypothetical protein
LLTATKTKHRPIPRTSSGLELPRGVDFRTRIGRRFRDLYEAYAAELGAPLSEPEKAMVRQAVALQMQAEAMQQQIASGVPVAVDDLVRVNGEARRAIGMLKAKAVKSKPSGATALQEYLASRSAQAVEAPEANEEL